jgi:hypothetical protein
MVNASVAEQALGPMLLDVAPSRGWGRLDVMKERRNDA